MDAVTRTEAHRRQPEPPEVGRCYTRARRLPLMIGRLPGSDTALWGGPYTVTQVVVACTTAVVLWWSRDLWAQFGVGWNGAILLGLPVAAALLVRRARVEGRDPLRVGLGVASAVAAPARGRTLTGVPWGTPARVRTPAATALIATHTSDPGTPARSHEAGGGSSTRSGGDDAHPARHAGGEEEAGQVERTRTGGIDAQRVLADLDETEVEQLIRAALWLRDHPNHPHGHQHSDHHGDHHGHPTANPAADQAAVDLAARSQAAVQQTDGAAGGRSAGNGLRGEGDER